jgi:nucleotide-binding universal stress UspA family protein
MTIRHLLVHLDKSEGSAVRADVAIALAKRFGARLTALYAVCDPDVPGLASRNRYVFVERAAGKAQAAFGLHAAASGLNAEWQADIGASDIQVTRAVVLRSRQADLVVLGQHEGEKADGSVPAALVEQTVLHSGRPILVVPSAGHFEAFGRRAVVAWNGSREAARAVHDALPLLSVAEEVTVLALTSAASSRGSNPSDSPDADGLVRHLADHAVHATGDHLTFDPASIEPADRLLSYLAETGADLLVIGAAGQQQSRSAVKRSLTRKVLEQMTVPALLSY